jgi:hypothetical protein
MATGSDIDDDEMLAMLNAERQRSIGFENDQVLTDARVRALEYYRGEMRDIPSLPNRSKAVSLDVADAIETILPDLVEIFTGGEDVAAFQPVGAEDEEGAQQETDVVNHVVFNENPGWLTFTSVFKDALQSKTGVFKWRWEDGSEEEERFEGKTAMELEAASQSGEIVEASHNDDDPNLYDFTLRRNYDGCVKVEAVAPEDISVARDTVWLPEATYVATRSRPRVQDLIASGIDADKLDELPAWSGYSDEVAEARDTVDEEETALQGDAKRSMRQIEVIEHYIRIKSSDGEKLWLVLTGGEGNSTVILRKQEVNAIQLSSITPFLVPHRFYGESIADKLIEIQRIKTALMRMTLDAGYFALNQRSVINMQSADATTVSDYLRNEPGVPIRAKGPDAIIPLNGGGLNFDTLQHLEFFSTVAEQRTGIVRNAQGLNPDTLHDTAKGAQQLMMMAQKRIRMIARTFAETGVKDLFLGVHALLREHSTQARTIRLRNKWVQVDPSSWGVRNDMTIEIGLGASGREHDMMVMDRVIAMQAQAVEGGLMGTLVTPKNIYNAAVRSTEKAGVKNPEAYFTDPDTAPPQQPQPDPKMVEVQGKMQMEQTKLQMSAQSDQVKLQQDQQKAASEYELKMMELQGKLQIQRETAEQEIALKRELLIAELQLKREELTAKLALEAERTRRDAERADYETSANVTSDVRPGGDPG